MASRPMFLPTGSGPVLVRESNVTFDWVAGMALSQARKRVASLHTAASATLGMKRLLEISSKSADRLGLQLSAFNLSVSLGRDCDMCVETAFQGSKVFRDGGPFTDLLTGDPRAAKADERIRRSGPLVAFDIFGERWPLRPTTAFYDWLYVNGLRENPEKAAPLLEYEGFTDIAFNPKKSWNCQARSAALYCSLVKRGQLDDALSGKEAFLAILGQAATQVDGQERLYS